MASKSRWKGRPQDTLTGTKGTTYALALFVQLSNVNGINRSNASSNGFTHECQDFEWRVATAVLDFRETFKVAFVPLVEVNVAQFRLEFGVDAVFEFWKLGAIATNVVVASLGVEVKVEAHGEGFAEFEHTAPLVFVFHPHHGLSSQITNRIVDFSPKDTAFFVTTVTSIQSKGSQQTNRGSGTSKSGHRNVEHFLGSSKELVVDS
mmetsp:Transcript_36144/g.55504  ORF Transcript_36144/g.55504 Transcript_36144/m.55504 type:complete len:206 (+) Transcript_36144:605-1222(+)